MARRNRPTPWSSCQALVPPVQAVFKVVEPQFMDVFFFCVFEVFWSISWNIRKKKSNLFHGTSGHIFFGSFSNWKRHIENMKESWLRGSPIETSSRWPWLRMVIAVTGLFWWYYDDMLGVVFLNLQKTLITWIRMVSKKQVWRPRNHGIKHSDNI